MKRIMQAFIFLITISVLLLLRGNLVVYEIEKCRTAVDLGEEVHGLDRRNTERGYPDQLRTRLLSMLPSLNQTLKNACTEIFSGNQIAVAMWKSVNDAPNITNSDFVELSKDCDIFRQRGYITEPVNREEEQFPLAFIIQMYKDVVQLEMLLRAVYRPQNIYCINVDKSSDLDVHQGMEAIAKCFHNVILSNVDVVWAKYSQVEADLVCMDELYNNSSNWRYVMSITGQEYPLKSNLDIVRILTAANGSNMVKATIKRRMVNRWEKILPAPVNVTLVKGSCHWALTRSCVDYILHDNRALLFRNWTRRTQYPDEHFIQSLSHSPQLGVPGAFTGWPETDANGYLGIIRLKIWADHKDKVCHGRFVRGVCIFGVGDLYNMTKSRDLFVNKLYYNYQPLALQCLEQRHYDMTRQDILGLGHDRINITFYEQLPNVINHIPSGLEH